MFKRYLPFYYAPPGDTGGGGSSDNIVASGSSGVTSGVADPDMISAAMASESSSEETPGAASALDALTHAAEEGEEEAIPGIVKPATTAGAAVAGAKEAPLSRIETAVKNARATAVTETEAKYAWAKDLDQESVGIAFSLASEILQDSKAFATKLASEIGMKLVPIDAAAAPASAAGAAPAAWDRTKLPGGKLKSEDGIEAYSKDQIIEIAEMLRTSLLGEMQGSLKPLLDDQQRAKLQNQQITIQNEARAAGEKILTGMRARPGFLIDDGKGGKKDNPKIFEYLKAIPVNERKANPAAALYTAYLTFMEKDFLPNVGTSAAAQVRSDNQRKAAASSSHRPGPSGGEAKKEIRGVSDLARRMEEMAAAGTT